MQAEPRACSGDVPHAPHGELQIPPVLPVRPLTWRVQVELEYLRFAVCVMVARRALPLDPNKLRNTRLIVQIK